MTVDRFHLAARATQDLIWDWDLVTKRVVWAGSTGPFFGCEPEEVASAPGGDYQAWASRVHPDDLGTAEAASAAALTSGAESWQHVYRLRRVSGSWAHVLERAFIVRDEEGVAVRVVGAIRDITDRIESGETKTRLAAIVASSSDAIIGKTLEGIVTSWNAGAERIFGYSAAEMVGQSIFRLIPDHLHESERELLERTRRGERVDFSDAERVTKSGRRISIALSVSPIWDDSGVVFGASSIKRDITESKQAAEELARREQRYRALVTATSNVVWTADSEGRFSHPQESWEAYTGQPWSEHAGLGWLNAFDPEERESARVAWAKACRDQSVFELHRRVWSAVHRTHRHVTVRAAPIQGPDGSRLEWIGMLIDVEELWLAEERLRQVEKMEVIGRLAGGVAHEANNQMTVVLGVADFLLRRVEDETIRQDVQQIRHAARRTATITQQLLAFGRRQMLQPRLVDLNAVVTTLRPILERALGETSLLTLELSRDLGRVMADPGQVEQVLLNLVLNARHAMPDGGALTIGTANIDSGQGELGRRIETSGPHVMLSVHDTGHGMDEETLNHIFEPFFTTKGVGEGTGLGLATVHGIVEQSGGSVSVETEPGQGATFRIYLPLAASGAAARPAGAGQDRHRWR